MITKPLKDNKGRVMSDKEFCYHANIALDKYYAQHNKYPIGANGRFVQFMREWKTAIDNGQDATQYKKKHVVQTVPYDMLVQNTNKRSK